MPRSRYPPRAEAVRSSLALSPAPVRFGYDPLSHVLVADGRSAAAIACPTCDAVASDEVVARRTASQRPQNLYHRTLVSSCPDRRHRLCATPTLHVGGGT